MRKFFAYLIILSLFIAGCEKSGNENNIPPEKEIIQNKTFPVPHNNQAIDLGLSVKWAPDNENDTNKYISDVCYWSGFSPNTVINPYNQTQMCKLVYAMAIKENGYSPNMSDVTAGWNLYIG